MKFWSDSWTNGDRIPERFAAGKPDGQGGRDLQRQHQPASGLERGARRGAVAGADLPRFRRAQPWRRRQPAWARSAGRLAPGGLLPLGAGGSAGRPRRTRRRRVQPGLHGAGQARASGTRQRAPWLERLHELVCRRRRDGRQLLRLRRPLSAVQRFADPPLRVHAVRRGLAAAAAGRCIHRGPGACGDGRPRAGRGHAQRHLHAEPALLDLGF
jgi:hypothetical protein